jgi:surface polysaccharide O-acyltransferase-like enzyme
METNSTGSSGSHHDSLIELHQAETITRRPWLPTWYFTAMAGLVAVLMVCQTLPSGRRTLALFAVLLAALVINNRAQRLAGISWIGQPIRGQLPFLLAMAVVIAGTAAVVAVTGETWVWAVGAVPAALVVLVTGVVYRRRMARR